LLLLPALVSPSSGFAIRRHQLGAVPKPVPDEAHTAFMTTVLVIVALVLVGSAIWGWRELRQ
jgi:hypothetical protein